MPTPSPQWAAAVDQAITQLNDLCTELQHAPITDRLHALATLNRAFTGLHNCALRDAIIAAREQGWPLRRIATALDCSHEQVRILAT